MEKQFLKMKLLAWVAGVILVVGLYFVVLQHFEIKKLKKELTENVDAIKTAKELVIQQKLREINNLKRKNRKLDKQILGAQHSIDSLEHVKSKIKVVYKDRIEQIKGFDGKELENYWRNEFN